MNIDLDRAMATLKTYAIGQAQLGYTTFLPGPNSSDVILATFPKSGSTWTAYLLHQLRSKGDHDFVNIKDEVIDITPGHWDISKNPFLLPQRFSPRTFKTHGSYALCPKGGKYIYIARNPKDTLWSLYCFLHDLFGLDERMSLEEFYTHYYVNRFDSGHDIGNPWDHFLGWYPHRNDDNVLWLHFEDLIEDRTTCLRAIAHFMEVELSESEFQLVVERSQMEAMRKIASKINPSPNNYVGKITAEFGPETTTYGTDMKFGKMRRGKVGDGKQNLPDDILADLKKEWQERITPVLGYRDYAEMREACSLLKS